jgi:hypothetical protein
VPAGARRRVPNLRFGRDASGWRDGGHGSVELIATSQKASRNCAEFKTPRLARINQEPVTGRGVRGSVVKDTATKINVSLGLRSNYRVLNSGIQLAANNMPQGDTLLVPLTRNIGRQHQVHFLIHFEDYTPDLGRKGFHRELTDFAKSVARTITENHLSKFRQRLKANTGVAPDLIRELEIGDWKRDMLAHEKAEPLDLRSEHFFIPIERVSITSKPTREQDVIALFHQLIAGGVVRGINVMSTNERCTYDGLFKIEFDLESHIYTYCSEKNPLGVPAGVATALKGKGYRSQSP